MPGAPRNTMMSGMNMYGPGPGSVAGSGFGPGIPQPRMSTLSFGTAAANPNPFAGGPDSNANPSDEELLQVLKGYLATQDLMQVTKK